MIKKWLTLGAAPVLGMLVTAACVQTSDGYYAGRYPERGYPGPFATAAYDNRGACLANNRIWGWRVLDERTLIVNDYYNRPFLVRLSGGCVGLTNASISIAFRTSTRLGCLRRGDSVMFREPTLGGESCFVTNVEPYAYGPLAGDVRPYRSDIR
jgi:hypothetical protein